MVFPSETEATFLGQCLSVPSSSRLDLKKYAQLEENLKVTFALNCYGR